MTTPRVEVDLNKIRFNTRFLVQQLLTRGISVTGVTKAVRGHPVIAQAMLDGGATDLAEPRISNVTRLRNAGISCPISLIRTPMLSQVDQVVQKCEISYNSEIDVIAQIAVVARQANSTHGIILMVEMGDMREGILPENVPAIAQHVVNMAGVDLKGIAANFGCLSGIGPTSAQMQAFSELASQTEAVCGPFVEAVSGGGSASLPWALGSGSVGRVNNLRLGEAILLGRDPITGDPINGLHTDAFTLVAEVIEAKVKFDQFSAEGATPTENNPRLVPSDVGRIRTILALGLQDTDVSGLFFPDGLTSMGATSDHLVVQNTASQLRVGGEVRFQMMYSALMTIMTAPDTNVNFVGDTERVSAQPNKSTGPHLALV